MIRAALCLPLALITCRPSPSDEPGGDHPSARPPDPTLHTSAPLQGGQLGGRLLDELGMPIADALLQLGGPATARTARSNAQGRFVLAAAADRALTLDFSHPLFGPRRLATGIWLRADQGFELGDLRLSTHPGLIVALRHKDSRRPVAGAELRIRPRSTGLLPEPGEAAQRFRSDAEGLVHCPGLAAGSYRIEVHARSFAVHIATHQQPPSAEAPPRLRLDLSPGRRLRGRLTDPRGKPLARARLRLSKPSSGLILEAETDAFGSFRLDGLPAGVLQLEAYAEGLLPLHRELRSLDGFLRLQMHAGRQIEGRILPPHGDRGLAGARIWIPHPGHPGLGIGPGRHDPQCRSDVQGNFVLRGVPTGRLRLHATSVGHAVAIQTLPENSGEAVTLRLSEAFRLSGKILNPAGQPLANTVIQAIPALPTAATEALLQETAPAPAAERSGPHGRFALTLPSGRWRLRVRAEGHAPRLSRVVEARGGQSQDLGALHLAPAGAIHGRAQDAHGRPAARATVYALPAPRGSGAGPKDENRGANPGTKALCDADGRFRLIDLAPGPYRLFYDFPVKDSPRAAAARRAATRCEVEVRARQVTQQILLPIKR